MSKVLLCLAGPPPSTIFSPEAGKLPGLPTRQRNPVRGSPVEADLTRQSSIVSGRRQCRAGSLALGALRLVEGVPFWTVVDRTIFEDQSAVLAGRLDTVRVDKAAALGTTAVGLLGGGDVLVERPLVDVS